MSIESASQFSFLPSKPCYFPHRPALEIMVHQGKPTISNLVLSPPMNQTLVSATLVVEPELNLHVKLPPPFFWLLLFKNKTGQWNKEGKGKKEVGVFMIVYLRPVTDPVSDPLPNGLT